MEANHSVRFVILGGGLTGLSIAYNLSVKENEVILVEREPETGGLARSFSWNGYTFDIGPKIFRSSDPALVSFVSDLLPMQRVQSRPMIFRRPDLYMDPVTPVISSRNIELIPSHLRAQAMTEIAALSNRTSESEKSSFQESIVSQIGQTLYHYFFGEYTKKWWGICGTRLATQLAPKEIVLQGDPFYGHITTQFRQVRQELYPVLGGIGAIATRLRQRSEDNGVKFLTNSSLTSLQVEGNAIVSGKVLTSDGRVRRLAGDFFISTIPITSLCQALGVKCRGLSYRSLVCIYLALSRPRLFEHSWIYSHDPEMLFSRLSETTHYSVNNAPKDCTGLCVEVTCEENDRTWLLDDIAYRVTAQLIELELIEEAWVRFWKVVKVPNAYPIPYRESTSSLNELYTQLAKVHNLRLVGRTGAYVYTNMDAALEFAIRSRSLLHLSDEYFVQI